MEPSDEEKVEDMEMEEDPYIQDNMVKDRYIVDDINLKKLFRTCNQGFII